MIAPASTDTGQPARVGLAEIFLTFLVIGATSFGGGVVAYLRNSLVLQKGWLDEERFLSALEIAQTLPGLNATNMSVIVGDRLRGPIGAFIAFLGMTLPGATLVMVLGVLYAAHSHNPAVNAALVGVGAASVGMLSAVTLQIGRKQFGSLIDIAIIVATIILVSYFRVSLLVVLFTVGPVAVFLYRPKAPTRSATADSSGDAAPSAIAREASRARGHE
ncbi:MULTISPECIES: chromate transporter [unclassified Chelatococcus]|uniref:chromate transporter n=1 Tax=unclassified Chelatococcus TaxID=2638111 RepID=UPI001BCC12F2|nr:MULTISPECIES: chromate transporter [unclassified Chelatococcus]CAH1671574.1 Chromate transporter [Hyphomicrobiales bacterium]MBS7739060.1 chromate transporter [Chelatococcus sp. HY11]MBX3543495.1 chromate transporter [Chelatococcus sp.]MCO5076410.1 chromate transporter [Chelatococcus sp.]CAH1676224.1 Chromate transporter [Hyphomicrobiales bacterium]